MTSPLDRLFEALKDRYTIEQPQVRNGSDRATGAFTAAVARNHRSRRGARVRTQRIAARVALAGLAFVGLVVLAACEAAPVETTPDFLTALTITPDPSGHAPLTAEATLTTSRPVQVELIVVGRDSTEEWRHDLGTVSGQARLPILGLYPSRTNTVTLRFSDPGGAFLADVSRSVATPAPLRDLPAVTIDAATPAAMTPGMNLVSYFGHDGQFLPQRPFIFDAEGRIRWYLDFNGHPTLASLFYDNGVQRLANGNLYFGDGSTGRIIELDMLGRIVRTWALSGYGFHHQVLELPSGNFLVTVNQAGAPTVEDRLIELDRQSGAVAREWDLTQSLDATRRAWPTDLADLNVDWFHANGVAYDPRDGGIIVSGRTQGTVKLTPDNAVVWILAPHRGWGTAGDGTDLTTRLLQPLDAAGQPITDPAVLDGTANHPDFEWAWYQHCPLLLDDGTLLLFDNGDNRNYTGQQRYSRAVAYRIDETAMTVRQLWQYGAERGAETYSRIVSAVDYHAAEDNLVLMPGAAGSGAGAYGKVVEIDYSTRAVVFEATITPPTAPFGITFHRVKRLSLYPPD
ncbi:MAG: aryl-sulfate sulfotransferase [Gemmatimonadota bacterium]|nr:aryl-sulfate sulfotransferase [Gemmatimonadota bacterium]